jgi:hypothetical protein
MWPFDRRRARGLDGVAEQLWSYDARRGSGWRLDVAGDGAGRLARRRATGAGGRGLPRQRGRLRHYIAAGGMRHQLRTQRAARAPRARRELIWRIFACYVLCWLLCRWLEW